MEKTLTLQESHKSAVILRFETIKVDEQGVSVSKYTDALATDSEIGNAMQMLSVAFPMADKQVAGKFYLLLANRIKANKMTGAQLRDAVGRLLDSHQYPTIKIADVVGFDKREKLYSYTEVLRDVSASGRWGFEQVGEINGRMYWRRK